MRIFTKGTTMKRIISVISLILVLCFAMQSTCFAVPVFTDATSAGEYIAEQMKKISTTVEFDYSAGDFSSLDEASEFASSLLTDIFNVTMAHTGDANGGDYLRYTYENMSRQIEINSDSNGKYGFHFTYGITYRINPTQETELTEKLKTVLPTLLADCKNDYDSICAIHDYILKTVTYDNLSSKSYNLRYTAYAAAINGTSVCEGYALLFYRMCLLAGIDCRVVIGRALGGAHSWNIVKLDGRWYNIDCTWNDSLGNKYFLVGSDNFKDHTSTATYISADYAVSSTDFDRASYLAKINVIKGDADGNGKVNVLDARQILRVALGRENAVSSGVNFSASDLNSDGKITVADARSALRLSVGLE